VGATVCFDLCKRNSALKVGLPEYQPRNWPFFRLLDGHGLRRKGGKIVDRAPACMGADLGDVADAMSAFLRTSAARFGCFLSCFSAAIFPVSAADYYVSPRGSDANPGTLNAPWRTVQKAADAAAVGDTVHLRKGIYKELVTLKNSGQIGMPVTFRNYVGPDGKAEKVVISAAGKAASPNAISPLGGAGVLLVFDKSYIRFVGLELRNFTTRDESLTPAGVWIEGQCREITIEGCKIANVANSHANGNAFGVVAYGSSAAQAITGLKLMDNEIFLLKTGNSESVALNGNVDGFEVSGNYIHDCNNIGLDFIGLEGTCPNPALDRARNGVCRGNVIRRISTRANRSYGGELSAGGIYCDGSKDIIIERNSISSCDIGVELASEAVGGSTTGVVVRNNFIYRCSVTGVSLGGYEANRGATTACVVRNNTLYSNDTRRTGTGEISFQHNVANNTIAHNIVYAASAGLMLGSQVPVGAGNILAYNLYYTRLGEASAFWEWAGQTFDGRAAWLAEGREFDSGFANPLLVKPASGNLRIASGSPAIDAGDPAFLPDVGENDIDGGARLVGARVDIGADEFVP